MALFAEVATLAEALAAEASRLKKRAAIAALTLRLGTAGPPEDLRLALLYLAGQPFAEADPRKLNAGGALLSRAVKEVTAAPDSALTAAYRRHGDLGAAAYDLLAPPYGKASTESTLTLAAVAEAFAVMATARSTQARFAAVESLLRRATALEAKYLLKLMLGDMRIGVKQSLIEEAIAAAATEAGHPAEVAAVRHAVMLEADLGRAAERAFAGTLAEARMTLFHPLGFMLASPVETPEEAIARFTEKPKPAPKPKPKKRSKKSAQEDTAEDLDTLPADASETAYADDIELNAAADPTPNPVISTEAQRSGETCSLPAATLAGLETLAGVDLSGITVHHDSPEPADLTATTASDPTPNPVISTEAQRSGETCSSSATTSDPTPNPVISTEAQRSGETCSSPATTSAPPIHAFLEDKFDGMRAQLHFADPATPARVALYSRNREDITESFPDLVEAFALPDPSSLLPAPSSGLILDGEILGWDFATGQALPFATLGQRIGRKRVDNALRRAVPVVFMAFDLIYADAELQLPKPLAARRARLEEIVSALAPHTRSPLELEHSVVPGGLFSTDDNTAGVARLMLSPARLVESADAIDLAYRYARARANEGVMLKSAASTYLPGRRGLAWLKLKRTLDTLDVVITGAEFGHGRRAQLLSDYTFAVQGPDGQLLNVGKAYSGVTDAEIAELTTWLKAHTLEDHGHFRTVEPLRILEVAFNNVMRSDRHASGFALRFPRILRLRDDKPLTEIDTLARVEEIFQSQPDRAGD